MQGGGSSSSSSAAGGLPWTVAHLRAAQSPEEVRTAIEEASSNLAEDAKLPAKSVLAFLEELALDNAKLRADLAQATRAREVLLSNIAHDLRNPLNTFAMSAGLLRDDLESPEFDPTRGVNLVSRMDRASSRMQAMIEDLLEASRVEARAIELTKRTEQASAIARAAIAKAKPALAEKNATLEELPLDESIMVECDRARTVQALDKLILLALKSTGDGGTIRVGVEAGGATANTPALAQFMIRATPPRGQMNTTFDEARGGLALVISRGLLAIQGGELAIEVLSDGPRIVASLPSVAK